MLKEMANYYTIVFQWSHAVQLALVAAAIVCVLTPLKAERKSVLIGAAETAGVFLACMLSEMVFFGLSRLRIVLGGMCFPLALLTVIVVYAAFFCRFHVRLKIITAGMLYAALACVTVYIAQFTQIMNFPNNFLLQLASVAFNLLSVVTTLIFVRFTLSKFIDIPGSCTALVLVSSASVAMSIFIYYILTTLVFNRFDMRHSGIAYSSMAGSIMYVMTLVTYLLMYLICQRNERVLELQAEKKMAEADEQMLGITQKSLSDLRSIRHDIKNSYSYMALLLKNKQYAELGGYLESMCGEIQAPLAVIDCGNRTITNILNMEKAKAELRGISLTAELNVPPVLPFKDTALCSVFSNLIDNAIEACERSGIAGAEIRVRVSILQEYLYIGVVNPLPAGADEKEILKLNSSKEDAAAHGYGTKIVRKIAEHYNGYVTYSVEKGRFIAEVMFDIMREGGARP